MFSEIARARQTASQKKLPFVEKAPQHPGLRFKRIHTQEPLYSVRVGLGWRALGIVEDDSITWIWIGSHAEYDRLLARL